MIRVEQRAAKSVKIIRTSKIAKLKLKLVSYFYIQEIEIERVVTGWVKAPRMTHMALVALFLLSVGGAY